MDAQIFWDVIGRYNQQTFITQTALGAFLPAALLLSYAGKIRWLAKFVLGILNIYIGLAFFGIYGAEPVQRYFALPLYVCCGCLFLYECVRRRRDRLRWPGFCQVLLLLFYVFYPLISLSLGGRFPRMVTYIMPCPVISLSIVVYTGYRRKNLLLLLLLAVWGITGVKSMIFQAYEDLILLVCGIYGAAVLVREMRARAAGSPAQGRRA